MTVTTVKSNSRRKTGQKSTKNLLKIQPTPATNTGKYNTTKNGTSMEIPNLQHRIVHLHSYLSLCTFQ